MEAIHIYRRYNLSEPTQSVEKHKSDMIAGNLTVNFLDVGQGDSAFILLLPDAIEGDVYSIEKDTIETRGYIKRIWRSKMQLKINCLKGVNDVAFEMSPDEVSKILGNAESTKTVLNNDGEIPDEKIEIRSNMKFMYEKEKLVCICGDLGVPLFLKEDRIPRTFLEAYRMLMCMSKTNMRFPKSTSYVFADLGIVIYPSKTIDIDGGNPNATTHHRIAVCNTEVLERYLKYFVGQDDQCNNDIDAQILGFLGDYAEISDKEQ